MDLQQKPNLGVREDISDIIIELQAEDTPAFSLIAKGDKPNAPIMQQPVDAPGWVSRRGVKNGTPAKPITDQSKDYNLLQSCNHMITTSIGVGKKDQSTVNRAGVGKGKLYAKELAKGIVETKKAIDSITLDAEDQREESGNGSETRGLFSWASPDAQNCLPVPAKYRPASAQFVTGSLSDLTPDSIKEALNARWRKTHSKGRLIAICGENWKSTVSNWSTYLPDKQSYSTVRSFNQDVANGKKERVLNAIIDMLEFDTGIAELHLDPFLLWNRDMTEADDIPDESSNSCIMFSKDAVKYHFAQEIEHERLGNSGAGEEGQISTIFHTMATPFDLCAWKLTS